MNFISPFNSLTDRRAARFPWPERIILCLAVLISYASVWPNEFVFDDNFLIVKNSFLKSWAGLPDIFTHLNFAGNGQASGFYRPVPMLLHFIIYQVFGASTIAFHALNLGLQTINACLLHHFAIRAGFKRGAAFAAALLWAVHPLHSEAVAYMSSTPELLWATFLLLGLIIPLPDFTPSKMAQAAVFFILALGSKETAVVFPALVAVTLFFISKDRKQLSTYFKTWPLWLMAAAYITGWTIFIHKSGYSMDKTGDAAYFQEYTTNITNRILTCLATLPVYAQLIIFPQSLHMERDFPISHTLLDWRTATGAMMTCVSLLQILWGRLQKGLALSFGVLWFAIALSPATGIGFPINARLSEHWLYFPLMGLFLGIMQSLSGFFINREKMAQFIILALSLLLGTATFLQSEKWRNAETLYQSIQQSGGFVQRMSDIVGLFYLKNGQFDKAIEQFQYLIDNPKGPETAGPYQGLTHMRIAFALLGAHLDKDEIVTAYEILRVLPSSRRIPEAIGEFNKALESDPNCFWAHKFLAIIYRYQGKTALAAAQEKLFNEHGTP